MAGIGIDRAYIQGPLVIIADTPVDFGCDPGDIAVGTGYQLAGAGVNPVQIEPISISGYQFIVTGGGADIFVSCISTTEPVATARKSTRENKARESKASESKASEKKASTNKASTNKVSPPDSKPDNPANVKEEK